MFASIIFYSFLIVIFFIIIIYNRLVRLENLKTEGWSGIDVQLKQRADLIPNLVQVVKGYMAHESGVLEKVTELRTQAMSSGNIEERAKNEDMLSNALKQLFAVSENYPDLKASQNFIALQNALANIEDQIQLARRYYNGTARNLNIYVQSFPSNVIAKIFGFKPAEFFGIENATERQAPTVKFS